MRSLEEIKAPFVDADGEVEMTDLDGLLGALSAELEGSIGAGQLTPVDHLQILERWLSDSLHFIVEQMFEGLVFLHQLDYGVSKALGGEVEQTPEEIIEALEKDKLGVLQALALNRLVNIHRQASSKVEKKIEVVKG